MFCETALNSAAQYPAANKGEPAHRLPNKSMEISKQNGFVLAYKEAGLSSNLLVGRLRRALNIKRVGHTGTLDRFADGLMLLLVGRATSLAEFFLHRDKSYRAVFQLGRSTDTHDPEGKTLVAWDENKTRKWMCRDEARLRKEIQSWLSQRSQVPPLYSALKKQGRRYSDLAREGKRELPESRPIRVYAVEIRAWEEAACRITVELHVSGGTYIRSFARDLSEASGIPIHLSSLTRLSIGSFSINDAKLWKDASGRPEILDVTNLLPEWPRIQISDAGAKADISFGRKPMIDFRSQALDATRIPDIGENFFLVEAGTTPSINQIQALAWAVRTPSGYDYKRILSEPGTQGHP